MQIDDSDYTENGDECENKCQWYYDDDAQNISEFTMKCLDINGTWAHCTPFSCKTTMFCINKWANKVMKSSCNIFVCLVIGYTNNGEQCRNICGFYDESYNWCWTVDQVDDGWDYCTPTGKFFFVSPVLDNMYCDNIMGLAWVNCLIYLCNRSLRKVARQLL